MHVKCSPKHISFGERSASRRRRRRRRRSEIVRKNELSSNYAIGLTRQHDAAARGLGNFIIKDGITRRYDRKIVNDRSCRGPPHRYRPPIEDDRFHIGISPDTFGTFPHLRRVKLR